MIAVDISPGGIVEVDVEIDATKVDNFGESHSWTLHGHIVHACE